LGTLSARGVYTNDALKCAASISKSRLGCAMKNANPDHVLLSQRSSRQRWLPSLEKALKGRIGWVDEIITPFARRRRKLKPQRNTEQRPAV
jgi:hypothetical protein